MRLADRLRAQRFNPSTASSAAFVTTYGSPNSERMVTSFQSYARDGYAGNGIVFGIIGVRMDILSGIRFQWRDRSSKKMFGSSSLGPLESPWPNGTTSELIARMEQDASLAGNAYVRTAGQRLERLRPDWVTIISTQVSGVREVIGYNYRPVLTDTGMPADDEFIPVEEMCHWSPIPDPVANFRGMSWMTPVVREINADTAMTRHKGKFFDNAATPNAVVTYKTKLSKPVVEEVQEALALRHSGIENAYKTVVLDAGADYTVIGNSFEQMNFTTVQAAGENRIAVAAGVPGIVAGLKEGLSAATYSNYAQARRAFADQKAFSLWRSMCAALSVLVEVPSNAELWFDTSDVPALHDTAKDRAEIAQIKAATYGELVRAGGDRVEAAQIADAFGEGLGSIQPTGNIYYPGAQAYFTPTEEPTAEADGAPEAPQPPAVTPNGKPKEAPVGGAA